MTAQEFIFNAAPYRKVSGEDFIELYRDLSKNSLSVNGYNPQRGVETTYHIRSYTIQVEHEYDHPNSFEPLDFHIRVLSFRCGRFSDLLTLALYCDKDAGYMFKIGTHPSLRDFHKDDIKKYEKVLNEKQKTELITAIMIANNGVGIGSYVYLRRIFEGIVFEEANRAIKEGVISETDLKKKRMDEIIVAIKDYLPAFLFEHHKELYGILSMGVHQLDEDDCLVYFPVLYDCIVLILDDRLTQKEKELTTKKAAASLSKIAAKVKGDDTLEK